jgi:NhaP-type Na+/H+ or K+/H+ antiporter
VPGTGFDDLFIVALVALLAPLTVATMPSLRVPAVVVEIVAGVVLGPDVLGVVDTDLAVQVLSVMVTADELGSSRAAAAARSVSLSNLEQGPVPSRV